MRQKISNNKTQIHDSKYDGIKKMNVKIKNKVDLKSNLWPTQSADINSIEYISEPFWFLK